MKFSDFFAAERRFYRRGASLAVCSALLLSLALPCAGASAANGNAAANGNLANGNAVVSAAGDADTFIEISDAAGLIAALGGDDFAELREDGSVMLLRDVELTSELRITGGDILLLGAGVTVSGAVISVFDGSLTVGKQGDTGDEPSLRFTRGGSGRAFEVSGGTLVISDGVRINGCDAVEGGAVSVTSGALELRGGEIYGCTAVLGGAVIINSGRMVMYSGQISSCSADQGGAIYLRSGSFELSGGCIGRHSALNDKGSTVEYGEPCSAASGGGIYVGSGECTLSGGEISECDGSGIYISKSGSALISGSAVNRCTAEQGGGIYNSGSLKISDGSVNECVAEQGGGVYNSGSLTVDGGKLFSCTAQTLGGCLYNDAAATAELSGGAVTSGSAEVGACIYNAGSFLFTGGAVGHGKTESGVGAGLASTGGIELSAVAYIYNDSALSLISDGGFEPLVISGELTGADIMMHIEVIEQGSDGMRALRSPGAAVIAADSPELLSAAACRLRYGGDIEIKADGTVAPDMRQIIIACAAVAVAAAAAVHIIVLHLRARKKRMELM